MTFINFCLKKPNEKEFKSIMILRRGIRRLKKKSQKKNQKNQNLKNKPIIIQR